MLIDFCNSLKKGGLYLIGNVIVVPKPSVRMAQLANELQMLWVDYISITNIKSFNEITLANSLRNGFYSMFMLSGKCVNSFLLLSIAIWPTHYIEIFRCFSLFFSNKVLVV
jgi:hypothetical protein